MNSVIFFFFNITVDEYISRARPSHFLLFSDPTLIKVTKLFRHKNSFSFILEAFFTSQ